MFLLPSSYFKNQHRALQWDHFTRICCKIFTCGTQNFCVHIFLTRGLFLKICMCLFIYRSFFNKVCVEPCSIWILSHCYAHRTLPKPYFFFWHEVIQLTEQAIIFSLQHLIPFHQSLFIWELTLEHVECVWETWSFYHWLRIVGIFHVSVTHPGLVPLFL